MYQSVHDTYFEDRILSASPVELVHMLYQGAIGAVQDARHHLKSGKIMERSRAINKVCAILMELTAALDHEAGGELSSRLAGLYGYMQRRLLEANFQQSDGPLGEVLGLLATLDEGWAQIAKQRGQGATAKTSWEQASYPMGQDSEPAYSAGSWSL
jgi:flagellar secretion chaperone FliS